VDWFSYVVSRAKNTHTPTSGNKEGKNVCNPKLNKNSFSLSGVSLLCDLISEKVFE